jgi:hypothetical protein
MAGSGYRQPEDEVTTLARGAFYFQPAIVGDDQVTGDAQTQARALIGVIRPVHAIKGCKDTLLVLGCDTLAGVAYPDPDHVLGRAAADGNRATSGGVLDGVAEQVPQGLAQAVGIHFQRG